MEHETGNAFVPGYPPLQRDLPSDNYLKEFKVEPPRYENDMEFAFFE